MEKFSKIINNSKPVLIDFYADWCGPCQAMGPILKEVKNDLQNDVSIIKINVDKNPEISRRYGVRGIPTFFIFKNGEQLWRKSGILKKDELVTIINSFS